MLIEGLTGAPIGFFIGSLGTQELLIILLIRPHGLTGDWELVLPGRAKKGNGEL